MFRRQPEAYRAQVLGQAPRVAIEVGVKQGWQEWIRRKDAFVGLSDFGASAPAPQLYEHFGVTPAKVVEAVKRIS